MRNPSSVSMSDVSSVRKSRASSVKIAGVALLATLVSAHVGSPDVFFAGKAGPYDVRVVVRPPQVVPGVARVTVRAPSDVERVSIRPVYWRAGSKGAPSADAARRLEGQAGTFEGSLWLMARGAYTVDVSVSGPRGTANVLVPVASVATGRLALSPILGALLAVFGFVLVAGLVNIVYKAAGESLTPASQSIEGARLRGARKVAAMAVPIIGLAVFGGARWWGAVDRDYANTIYRPSPLELALHGDVLDLSAKDDLFLPGGRVSGIIPDHGKLMHLFAVRADDGRAFAHLHPKATDPSPSPTFRTRVPPLPPGRYHLFGDVVHETGFERTLVGSLDIAAAQAESRFAGDDPDDSWFVGDASSDGTMKLGDGSIMTVAVPSRVAAGQEDAIRVMVRDGTGNPARLEPYLGMSAHGVVTRLDGTVYVHLHPMGTITLAAQQAFLARDQGDTTSGGQLRLDEYSTHAPWMTQADSAAIEFPYAFPRAGSYRLFVQVKRNGRILTGAFAITVAESAVATR